MHGPDGTNYANHVEWQEIVAPERLRYEQGSGPGDPHSFQTRVTFREVGESTEITLRSLFRTKAQREHVVEHFGDIEGGHQTLGRLAAYVEENGSE